MRKVMNTAPVKQSDSQKLERWKILWKDFPQVRGRPGYVIWKKDKSERDPEVASALRDQIRIRINNKLIF